MILSLLVELLDATPLPPVAGDVDALLALFAKVSASRETILTRHGALPNRALTTGELMFAAELESRQAQWMTRLTNAKRAR